MNILQILPELVVGGVETGTVDLAAELVKRGHKAVVVSGGGPLAQRIEKSGAKHYKLPVHKKSLASVLICAKALAGIIKEEQIQVVHARSRVPAIIAAIAARGLKKKNIDSHLPVFITTCHGYYSNHIFSRPMGWGRFVIVSSNAIARHMLEDFGVPFERIAFIPRGVDLSAFKFAPPSQRQNAVPVIAVIGRIAPIKGHQFFIRALSKVVNSFGAVKAVIVGGTAEGKEWYKAQLESLADKLGVSSSVEFQGRIDNIPQVLSKADLLVLPSAYPEAFGRVIIEAAAAGVPVVATRVGGVIDIVTDGKNGLLVNPEDAAGLADAITRILGNNTLKEELAHNARLQVEQKFTLSAMAEKTISVYQKAVKKARILVVKIGAPGDVVLTVPSLRALREKFPDAHMAVLVAVESRQLLQNCPYIDELIVYNKPFIKKKLSGFVKLARSLRVKDFDIVVDFQNSLRSHILDFLSCAPKRFGYRNKKFGFLLNYGTKDRNAPLEPVRHQFRVLSLLGVELKDDRLKLWPSDSDYRFADEFLAGQWLMGKGYLAGINVASSPRWRTKRLQPKTLSALCDEFAKRNITAVLTGSTEDCGLAGRIVSGCKIKPINAVGKTSLNQLAALVSKFKAFITSDSAPMHIAAAMSVPLVAVFGPTDPKRHTPPADKITVINKHLKCAPCYKTDCRHTRCMKEITVEEILEAVDRLNYTGYTA